MYRQLGVLAQAGLDVVRAGNDSEQARISRCLVIGILDQHTYFATGALQARRHCQRQHIAGSIRQSVMRHLEIERPGEQFGQPGSRERDVDADRQWSRQTYCRRASPCHS
jgi:hypothetical protein